MLGDMPNFNEILPKTGEGKWMVTIDTSSLNSKPKSKSARVTYYEEGLDSESLEEGNFLFVIYKIGAVQVTLVRRFAPRSPTQEIRVRIP